MMTSFYFKEQKRPHLDPGEATGGMKNLTTHIRDHNSPKTVTF